MVITFWNVDNSTGERPDLAEDLAKLAIETQCDILATAETGSAYVGFEALLQDAVDPAFRGVTPLKPKVHVWTRLNTGQLHGVASEERFEAFVVHIGAVDPTLVVFAHLPAKPKRPDEYEWEDAKEFATALRKLEEDRGTAAHTLVIGDLNLCPYDPAMRYPEAINAVPSRLMATRQPVRKRRGINYHRFYNPTWNLLGDANGPPGTHYWRDGGVNAGWYVLDHVLLRPGLIPRFQLPSLRVVTTIGGRNLISVDGGLPRKESDHLPLTFALEM